MLETNLSRIKQLMGESIKKDNKIFKVELTKIGPDGKSYGIVREGQKYFIKVSDKTKNILEEDFKYIGGLQNKTDFMYPTYAKAIKQLNLKFINLCEAYHSEYDVNTFLNDNIISESVENDIVCECSFQESDDEDDDDTPDFKINKPSAKISESIKKKTIDETTFKLKVPNQDTQPVVQKQTTTQITPQQPQQEPAPQNDKPFNDEPFDAGVEADEESDPKKFIQQLSGKLGQSLRKYTDETGQPDYDLEKFAINSVVSATHTADMDENDRKDIIGKINTAGGGDEEPSNEPTDNQDNAPDENNGEENNQDEPESFGESMKISENISIFAQTNKIRNMLRETFMRGTDLESVIDEVVNNTTVEPVVKPSVKPETTPSRRSKPFRVPVISPEDSPKPKAKM